MAGGSLAALLGANATDDEVADVVFSQPHAKPRAHQRAVAAFVNVAAAAKSAKPRMGWM